jgi:N6-adenosine-specific RNA methylase IME4
VGGSIPFPPGPYDIIYADPPWSYTDKMRGHSFSLDHEYVTQDVDWIKALPVKDIAATPSVLLLWAVSPQLPEALAVMSAWGYTFKTVAFCWSKTTVTGKDAVNLGRWTLGNVELCLLGVRGAPNSWRQNKTIRQLVRSVRGRHSAKPIEVRERIEQLFGNKRRLELFARTPSPGWDVWGDDPALVSAEMPRVTG